MQLKNNVEPSLKENKLVFNEGATLSRDKDIISDVKEPFSKEGGITLLEGNLGRSIINRIPFEASLKNH